MDKLILFLVRRKLGIRKYKGFMFTNQKSDDTYFFSGNRLYKLIDGNPLNVKESTVSLNWLINRDCKIVEVDILSF